MKHRRRRITPEIVARLTLDTEPWLSCEDCFRHVDEYVEQLLAGRGQGMAAMRTHLTGCPACAEEAATLLLLAASDAGMDPDLALQRLAALTDD